MMTEKVKIIRQDNLPIPLIFLPTPEALAHWYASGLHRTLERGERTLTITCFDTKTAFGIDMGTAAQAVLKAVTEVLYDHPETESLTILCGDDPSWRAYQFHWNQWYAAHRPDEH